MSQRIGNLPANINIMNPVPNKDAKTDKTAEVMISKSSNMGKKKNQNLEALINALKQPVCWAPLLAIVLVLIGEVVRVVSAKGRETEYKGLTPELAAQRLAEEAAEAEEN